MREQSKTTDELRNGRRLGTAERVLLLLCILCAAILYGRAFFGTELTDEAYYVADALGMVRGNLPYVLDNFSLGTGCAFLLIPPLWLYELLVPGGEGIFLFSRISFLSFRLLCIVWIALLLRRRIGLRNALAFSLLMLPYIYSGIPNYSYNTVPPILFCLVAVLLYDAVEDDRRRSPLLLFTAGFLSGIGVFANPGYACAVLFFMLLIPLRAKKGRRLALLLSYVAGGVLEILAVFVPLLLLSGPEALIQGFEPMFTDKFPVPPQSGEGLWGKLKIFLWVGGRMAVMLTLIRLAIGYCLRRKGRGQTAEDAAFARRLTMALGLCFYSLLYLVVQASDDVPCRLGVLAAIYVAMALLRGDARDYPLMSYLGYYSILFAVLQVTAMKTSDTVFRFWACLPALFAVLTLLLRSRERAVRTAAFAAVLLCTLLQLYTVCRFPYRDAEIGELRCRVESGVYKNIYTTPERARDLPELEDYLAEVVGEEDYYAYFDNVPCAYLMTHGGVMCDISSWDVLNYSYGRNMPAMLFDYYRRLGAIPDVIVYVDIGRDPRLSIEDAAYRYNDFVNAYYELTDDRSLNETFPHVMVFRYAGGYDGGIERWIEDYNTFPTGSEAA